MKKVILAVSLLILAGCSSSASNNYYYQLSSDFAQTAILTPQVADKILFIQAVNVADYLDQTGIIYQTDAYKYVAANNNLWLTPLSNQLQQRLVQDLSVLLPQYFVTNQATAKPTMKVELFIDSFHGSYTGDALIKGRWLITNSQGQRTSKNFDYTLRLNQDGYPELVKILAKGWQEEEIDLVRTIKW